MRLPTFLWTISYPELGYIFKSKKEREQNTRVKDALKQADETIKRIEAGLDKMGKDDETWKKIIGY